MRWVRQNFGMGCRQDVFERRIFTDTIRWLAGQAGIAASTSGDSMADAEISWTFFTTREKLNGEMDMRQRELIGSALSFYVIGLGRADNVRGERGFSRHMVGNQSTGLP